MEKWKNYRLGDICDVSSSKRIYSSEYCKSGVPFYRGKEIIEKHFNNAVSTELYISRSRYNEIKRKFAVPQISDILLTSVGTLGIPWLVDETEFYFKDGNLTWLKAKQNKISSKFLYLWLNSPQAQHQIDMMSIGSTQKALTIETLNKFCIFLPSLEIQEKVCSVFYSVLDKIKVNRQINTNLEQQAQAIFKSWFIDFEPFGGTMPDDWIEYRLGDFLPVITGKKNANTSSEKGRYPFFSCSHAISWTDEYSFDANAILVAGNGDFNVKWYNGKFEAYQRTYVLIPTISKYASWLYYAVKFHLSEITKAARGSVISFITKGNLEDFRFIGPKDINKFTLIDQFTAINSAIDNNIKEIYTLSSLRDTLLPKLMSGEIDVSKIELE